MKERSRFLFKNVGILTISNFASKILVFLLVPLYTSVLSTSEYGTYDLIVSTISLLFPILTANIIDGVMRFLMEKDCDKNCIALTGMKYILSSYIAIAILLFVLSRLNIWQDVHGLEIYICLYYILFAANQFFIQFAKGIERVFDMGVAGVFSTIITMGGYILFLIVFKMGLRGFLVTHIFAQAIPVLYFFFRLQFWKYLHPRKNNDGLLQKKMLLYSAPLIVTTLGWWVNSAADKYVVTFICGVAANGILAVAYKIPQILNTLQGIFIQAWQISAIKEYGENDTGLFYGEIFGFVMLLMSAACACFVILSKPLALLLYSKDFFAAWQYVPFLLLSSVLNCASGILGSILSAKKDSKSMALAAVYGVMSNIIMNIVFVYMMGIQGATIATVISSLIIYMVRKRKVGQAIKIEDYTVIVATWLLLFSQAVLEIYTSFWYAEVIVMIVMLWINRDRFLKGVKIIGDCFRRRK